MYFKAYISMTREYMSKDGEGYDPDTFEDLGEVETLRAETLEKLIEKIQKQYFHLTKPIGADVQIFDGALEICYDGEYDYHVPAKDQIPFCETVRITIAKVEETYLDLSNEPLFKVERIEK